MQKNANFFITAKDNPNIKRFRKLSSSKKERYESGCFVLEGYRLIRDALEAGICPECLLITESGWDRCADWIAALSLPQRQILLISDALGDLIAETKQPQGVFAICTMPQNQLDALQSSGRYLILHSLQDPGNLGMILRTADAFGVDGVLLHRCCDLYNPKTVRAAMGALFRVSACEADSFPMLLERCRQANIQTAAAVVDRHAEPIGCVSLGNGTAVVIGNEGNGLPKEDAALCDRQITIPMQGNANSLNAAMAAGIFMWELMKGRCQEDE